MAITENSYYGVNQLFAAQDTFHALREVTHGTTDLSLAFVKETNVDRLKRGLCLPSATATCMNALMGQRFFGDERDAPVTIGDFFRLLMPFHNKTNMTDAKGNIHANPWFVTTDQGLMYHQALAALAEGFQFSAMPIIDFPSATSLTTALKDGAKIAISLDNQFVLDSISRTNPELIQERDGASFVAFQGSQGKEFSQFRTGTHVVSLLGISEDNTFLLYDPFQIAQTKHTTPRLDSISPESIDPYLKYRQGGVSRAIAFGNTADSLASLQAFKNKKIFIPSEITRSIHRFASTKREV